MLIRSKEPAQFHTIPGKGPWLLVSVQRGVLEPLIVRIATKGETIREAKDIRMEYFKQGIWTIGGFEEGEQRYFNPETNEVIGTTYIFYIPAKDTEENTPSNGQEDVVEEAL